MFIFYAYIWKRDANGGRDDSADGAMKSFLGGDFSILAGKFCLGGILKVPYFQL